MRVLKKVISKSTQLIKNVIVKTLSTINNILLCFIVFLTLLFFVSFFLDRFIYNGYIYNWIINLMIVNNHSANIFATFENNLLRVRIFFGILVATILGRIIITKIIKKFVTVQFIKTILTGVINFAAYWAIIFQTITAFFYMIILVYVVNIYRETNPGRKIDFSRATLENIRTYLIDKQSSSSLVLKQIMREIENGNIVVSKLDDTAYYNLALNVCKLFENIGNVNSEEEHYMRNVFSRAPGTLSEMIDTIKNNNNSFRWKLLTPDYVLLHMYGEDGEYNIKFISEDGHFEAVYNKDGELLTEYNDPLNMGTFNYADQVYEKERHTVLDVLPYLQWGNTRESNVSIISEEYTEPSDFKANPDAVERYNSIYKIIYGKDYEEE